MSLFLLQSEWRWKDEKGSGRDSEVQRRARSTRREARGARHASRENGREEGRVRPLKGVREMCRPPDAVTVKKLDAAYEMRVAIKRFVDTWERHDGANNASVRRRIKAMKAAVENWSNTG